MLPRFDLFSVSAMEALLDEIEGGINERVLDTVRPKDPSMGVTGSELLANSPRKGLRDLLKRRGMWADESGSEARCTAEVD